MMFRKSNNDMSKMADDECDFSLLSNLKSDFPSIPLSIMLKVMNKCQKDQEKCRHLLEQEKANYPDSSDDQTSSQVSNNDVASVNTGIKELTVSHEPSSNKPVPLERHVSTIERSLIGGGRTAEPKKGMIGPSISWTVQPSERQPLSASQGQTARPHTAGINTPQTAPADFSPFFKDSKSATDIPNITCQAFSGSGQSAAPGQQSCQLYISGDSSSATNSPNERRAVKVINIPPGSSSGGSVSSAGMSSNPRHFLMHFGDTGGTCTVQTNPPTLQKHQSTPNINQHFRSELRTETSAPHAVHSSSIVVNTSPHGNHTVSDQSVNDFPQSSSPFQFVPSSATSNFQSSTSGSAHTTVAGKPLSTPVQASSPGVSHSRPVFVEIKPNPIHGYKDSRYPATTYFSQSMENIPVSVAGHPFGSYSSYDPTSNMKFVPEGPPDFNNHRGYGLHPSQPQQDHQNLAHMTQLSQPHQQQQQQQQHHPGYPNPPTTLYRPPPGSGYDPSYPPFNTSSAMGYSVMPSGAISRSGLGPNPSQQNHYNQYSHYNPHMLPGPPTSQHMISGAHGQRLPTNRTNSQDSEQSIGVGMPHDLGYANSVGSRVSSQSSVSSDTSLRGDMERPQSGSIQDDFDDEYIRTLIQHQRSRMQKMREDTDSQKALLTELRSEVGQLEKSMSEGRKGKWALASNEDNSKIRERSRQLQTEIQIFINELDMYKNGQTPFNQINPMEQQNFFDNMPTGQQDPIYVRSQDGNRTPSPRRPAVPPRPPPPIPARQRSTPDHTTGSGGSDLFHRVPPVPPSQPTINSGDSEEGEHWSCSACTFSNHPALKKCEMCEMPRVVPPSPSSSSSSATPQHPTTLPHRLAPGLRSHIPSRSGSPAPAPTFGGPHHHHRAGT